MESNVFRESASEAPGMHLPGAWAAAASQLFYFQIIILFPNKTRFHLALSRSFSLFAISSGAV